MRNIIHSLFLLVPLCAGIGCSSSPALPPFPRSNAMTVTLQDLTQFGIQGKKVIHLKRKTIDEMHELLRPTDLYHGTINKSLHTLIVQIVITNNDGSISELFVRWMGNNPVIVSFDDNQYYWAGNTGPGDGAVKILNLLLPRE